MESKAILTVALTVDEVITTMAAIKHSRETGVVTRSTADEVERKLDQAIDDWNGE